MSKSLPPELLSEIFTIVCDDHDPMTKAFRIACYRLTAVCLFWRDVANATPSMWHSLLVAPLTTTEHVDLFLQRSDTRPLAIEIQLSPGSVDQAEAESKFQHIVGLTASIMPSVLRWETLSIHTNHYPTVAAILGLIADTEEMAVTALSVWCLNRNLRHHPPLLFKPRLPLLRSLDLFGVSLDWGSSCIMPNLEYIGLDRPHEQAWPSYHQLRSLLLNTPQLKKLRLKAVGLRDQTPHPTALIELRQVNALELEFCAYPPHTSAQMYPLLSTLRFPSVTSLQLDVGTDADIQFVIGRHDMLQNLRAFTFGGWPTSTTLVADLFSKMGDVRELDITRAGGKEVLKALGGHIGLGQGAAPVPHIALPRLEQLAVLQGEFERLAKCLSYRSKQGQKVTAATEIRRSSDIW
ncbi:hypothetical protein DFH06DRAFT_1342094 [Mycena polygramma]|nr:hypothetical protein DFH06DRAFT_1342094 [Mycena polygramma]